MPDSTESIVVEEAEFNADLVRNMIPKLEWPALVQGAQQVRITVSRGPQAAASSLYPVPAEHFSARVRTGGGR